MIDLTPFTAPGDFRQELHGPIAFDGGTAATDGKILVWLDAQTDGATPVGESWQSRLSGILAGARKAVSGDSDRWVPAESVTVAELPCKRCNETGVIAEIVCSECDGDGDFVYGSHTYDCAECDGDGRTEIAGGTGPDATACPSCNGSRICAGPSSIGDVRQTIQNSYVTLMRELPECEILDVTSEGACFYFRFRGGIGVVMSYRCGRLS